MSRAFISDLTVISRGGFEELCVDDDSLGCVRLHGNFNIIHMWFCGCCHLVNIWLGKLFSLLERVNNALSPSVVG